ncbi:MAG: hypothetical protein M0R77_01215 [Gammaproteobacteria bacterium]|nr:hypothetical protein [Acholeplasmataceae bacterium]MCK9529176.1 hypothetical protein [Gammaproteobacteria bacterium]
MNKKDLEDYKALANDYSVIINKPIYSLSLLDKNTALVELTNYCIGKSITIPDNREVFLQTVLEEIFNENSSFITYLRLAYSDVNDFVSLVTVNKSNLENITSVLQKALFAINKFIYIEEAIQTTLTAISQKLK